MCVVRWGPTGGNPRTPQWPVVDTSELFTHCMHTVAYHILHIIVLFITFHPPHHPVFPARVRSKVRSFSLSLSLPFCLSLSFAFSFFFSFTVHTSLLNSSDPHNRIFVSLTVPVPRQKEKNMQRSDIKMQTNQFDEAARKRELMQ